MYNVGGQIGGDSDLSPRGWEYARALPDLIKKNIGEGPLEVNIHADPADCRSGRRLCKEHSKRDHSCHLRKRPGSHSMSLMPVSVMV